MQARAILFLISVAVWSEAQAQVAPPRFEVGGSGGAAVALGGDVALIFLIGPRLTFNATPRDALEVVADMGGPVENDGLFGLYLIQYKRVLRPRAASRSGIFLTAGMGGDFKYDRVEEYRSERPDGSVFVQPGYTHASLSEPFFGAIGIGVERVLARYAAVRSDLQVLAFRFGSVGLRGTVGITVPIGGYRDR